MKNKNQEIKKGIINSLIMQILLWLSFIILFELGCTGQLILNIGAFLLIFSIIIYYLYNRKTAKDKKFNIKKYKTSYKTSWFILGIIFGIIIILLVNNDILGVCQYESGGIACFLFGIEYLLYIVGVEIVVIIITLIDIILYFIKKKSR